MKLLLDTHIFLWLNASPEKITEAVRLACENENNALYLSMASVWEMQIKQQLGKLQFNTPWRDMLDIQQQDNGLIVLPIELAHIEALQALPAVHRDPFDRLLIAQAIQESMTIVTVDGSFAEYPVSIIA
ncbi:type II toxin-antitoxin system VapC family toxin [Methylomarinum vadi]|uniref:type II toxin-antitoxin system VapC family toxin n=1 Tax=Methylomarinum vadi TaxID=438855 RepID=UPI0004DF494E|nr:type II toxin-antitoxin system VapC family toxin [Methylomarinum vadi]